MSRSETYSDGTLRAIFRLNNYNYILKTLLNSELLNLVALVEPQCDKMYNDQIMEQKRLYSQRYEPTKARLGVLEVLATELDLFHLSLLFYNLFYM